MATEYRIYENNEAMKNAIMKTLSSSKMAINNVILMNISYSEEDNSHTLYSGMKYILHLRGEHKDTTPVIFYSFKSLEQLKERSEASILQSPAVEYIQMPFLIEELFEKIRMVTSCEVIENGLDKETKRNLTRGKVGIFKHDIQNAVNTVNIVYKLKRRGSLDVQKENWTSVKKNISGERNLISKNMITFETLQKDIIELLSEDTAANLQSNLIDAETKYKTLKEHLSGGYEDEKDFVISCAEKIVELLNEVITILGSVKI